MSHSRRPRAKLDLIEFKISGRAYDVDPNTFLAIDETRLGEELAQQSSKQAWIGVVLALAERLEARREFEVDIRKAKLDKEIREGAPTKLTEAGVKAAIQRHPAHMRAVEAHLLAKEIAGRLRAVAQAVRTRDFDLRELSARRRGEERGVR